MEKGLEKQSLTDNTKLEGKQSVNRIFLSCIPEELKKEEILEYFHKSYKTEFAKMIEFEFLARKKKGSRSIVNGLLTCSSNEITDKILEKRKHKIKNFNLKVKPYLTKEQLKESLEAVKKKRIYIKRLPDFFSENQFRHLLNSYGELKEAYLAEGGKHRKKGFQHGYAIFIEESSLENIPFEGIPFENSIIKWACFNKKKLKKIDKETSVLRQTQEIEEKNSRIAANRGVEENEQRAEQDQIVINEFKGNSNKRSYCNLRKLSRPDKIHFYKPGEVSYHSLDFSSRWDPRENFKLNLPERKKGDFRSENLENYSPTVEGDFRYRLF